MWPEPPCYFGCALQASTCTQVNDRTRHLRALEEVLPEDDPVDLPEPAGGEVDQNAGVQDRGEELLVRDGWYSVGRTAVVVAFSPQLDVEVDDSVGGEVDTVSIHDRPLRLVLHFWRLTGKL